MIDSDSDLDVYVAVPVRRRRQRHFKPRINFDPAADWEFREKFRLTRQSVTLLENEISANIQHDTDRNMALSPRRQLLLFLRFAATDGFYHLVGDAHGVSKATVCRVVHRVADAVVGRIDQYVRWPENLLQQAAKFRDLAGFPCVAAAIDGTHIRIKAPHHHEADYVNRHHQHSLNCLAAGSNLY